MKSDVLSGTRPTSDSNTKTVYFLLYRKIIIENSKKFVQNRHWKSQNV